MSDPTYLEGWNLTDPIVRIHKLRTKVALFAAFNQARAEGSVPASKVVDDALEALSTQYQFSPKRDYVESILDILVTCRELRKGTWCNVHIGIESVMPQRNLIGNS